MKKALVIVDMQNDFIDGKLGNRECQAVVPQIVDIINTGDYNAVIYTKDTHTDNYLDTQEGKKLPVRHCIYDTEGWLVNKDIIDALYDKKVETYSINKSTFGSLELAEVLQENYSDYDEIDFCGVCTGICVISNVAISKAALPEVKICVIENACACVTPDTHRNAIEAMKVFQVDII